MLKKAIIIAAIMLVAAFMHFGVFAEAEELANFRDFITPFTLLEKGVIVMQAHEGRLWARQFDKAQTNAANATKLVESTDNGLSWVFLYEFEKPIQAIYYDNNGNIFVTVSLDRWGNVSTGEVFKSSDGGDTFRKVLDVLAGAALNWNIASYNGLMFLSEYGYKGGSGNNARRIYRSFDFGETWDIVYEPEPMEEYHNHKILITANGTVFQSVGDGEHAKIIKSADNGNSWETVIKGFHPTSAVAFENHILWGLDSGPVQGISKLNKQTWEMDIVLQLPHPFGGSAYAMAEANGVVYAAFMSYVGHSHPGSIFYSTDEGHTWNVLGYIEKSPKDGVGLFSIVTDGAYGYIDFQAPVYHNGTAKQFRGTLRFELVG